jgi:hypothetical protein
MLNKGDAAISPSRAVSLHKTMTLQVTHKTQKFLVDFDIERKQFGEDWPSYVSLGTLLDRCSQATGIDVQFIKLLACGGKGC